MHTQNFIRDTRGGVAVILAICLLTLLVIAGAAIDFSRLRNAKTQMQSALDGAALSAALMHARGEENAAVLAGHAQRMFDANMAMQNVNLDCDADAVDLALKDDTVVVEADCALPTALLALAGIKSIDVEEVAGARAALDEIEVALMLDVSGSMAGKPIEALKSASNLAVDKLLTGAPGRVRIGLAPYSSSVNVGTYVETVINGPKNKGRSQPGCVSERKGANAFTEKSPKKGGGGVGYDALACPDDQILPLTDDPASLHAAINGLTAAGSTAGHLGIGWTWYILSPDWDTIWPKESEPSNNSNKSVKKIAILMTDGAFNTAYAKGQGNSVEQAEKLCKNMKSKGVVVYSVGFAAPPEARAIMKYCASDPSMFYEPKTPGELETTYKAIVDGIVEVHLMK